MSEEKKINMEGFEFSSDLFSDETGQLQPDFSPAMTQSEIEHALDNFAVVLQTFIQDFNLVMDQVGSRIAKLEKDQQSMMQIIHMMAQRTDWMMEGRPELIAKEREYLKAEKAKLDAKEKAHEEQGSVPGLPS